MRGCEKKININIINDISFPDFFLELSLAYFIASKFSGAYQFLLGKM